MRDKRVCCVLFYTQAVDSITPDLRTHTYTYTLTPPHTSHPLAPAPRPPPPPPLTQNGFEYPTLSFWCFNPGVAMRWLKQMGTRCLLLTSGTLSPLDSIAAELRLPFPVRLENPHVIDLTRVWVGVVSTGPNGVVFNSNYKMRDRLVRVRIYARSHTHTCPHAHIYSHPHILTPTQPPTHFHTLNPPPPNTHTHRVTSRIWGMPLPILLEWFLMACWCFSPHMVTSQQH